MPRNRFGPEITDCRTGTGGMTYRRGRRQRLGDRWVLSVAHVGAGSIVLDGTTYTAEPGSAVQLTNAGEPGRSVLTDLIFDVRGYSGQPSPAFTAVFGNTTYSVDLAYYRPQIMAIVPEPAGPTLAGLAVAAAAMARRRRWRSA